MNKRFLMALGGAVFFGLMAIMVANTWLQKQAELTIQKQQVKVVFAKVDIPIGATIQESQLEESQYPSDKAQEVAKDKKAVVGKVASFNIAARSPVLTRYLAAAGSAVGLSPLVKEGNRAVTVPVNESSSVAGFVMPGNHVDIISVMQPSGSSRPVARTILQDIRVLASGNQLQVNADPGQATIRPQNYNTVTLEADPEQAEILALAIREGSLHLIIRNPNDREITATKPISSGRMYGPAENEPRSVTASSSASDTRPRPPASIPPLTVNMVTPTPRPTTTPAPTPVISTVDVYKGKDHQKVQFPASGSAVASAKSN